MHKIKASRNFTKKLRVIIIVDGKEEECYLSSLEGKRLFPLVIDGNTLKNEVTL
jgi:hypothetical protein